MNNNPGNLISRFNFSNKSPHNLWIVSNGTIEAPIA